MEEKLLLGCTVRHKSYGKGEITNIDNGRIKVDFKGRVKLFVFPDAFESYLVLEDSKLMTDVANEIELRYGEKKNKSEAYNANYNGTRKGKLRPPMLLQVPLFSEHVCSEEQMLSNIKRGTSPCSKTECLRLTYKGINRESQKEIAYGITIGLYQCKAQILKTQRQIRISAVGMDLQEGQILLFVAQPIDGGKQNMEYYGFGQVESITPSGETHRVVNFRADNFVLLSDAERQLMKGYCFATKDRKVLFTGSLRRLGLEDGIKALESLTTVIDKDDKRSSLINRLIAKYKNN